MGRHSRVSKILDPRRREWCSVVRSLMEMQKRGGWGGLRSRDDVGARVQEEIPTDLGPSSCARPTPATAARARPTRSTTLLPHDHDSRPSQPNPAAPLFLFRLAHPTSPRSSGLSRFPSDTATDCVPPRDSPPASQMEPGATQLLKLPARPFHVRF
ncbi:hypothetical protein MPH_12210 [Macrophomina phaseolina MS6]|uniref:Uncharacterized protein n=1 Tax=Macrophomina phaseolina (strain MS6) TaxID=1126212 RepID=K2QLK6_MACPH|nr:hypothetical protein MPH_12210 [Macrophomina phaseolina MS6]